MRYVNLTIIAKNGHKFHPPTPTKRMKKLILIDGNAIFHRAYHSMPPFATAGGEVTNAIYGFLRMLIDLYKKEKPQYLGIAWDRKAPTYRHHEFKDYKATRAPPPDDLYPQLPRLKQVLETFNIPMVEMDGYEADDLLGTLAHESEKEQDLQTIIVTGDKDAFQLVRDNVWVMTPIKGISEVIMYNAAKVKEKTGVAPDQIIDYKALCGDASDNIPGVHGIGSKQTVELLNKYQTLENIYEHLDELSEGKRKKLTEGRESAIMSKRIATIQIDAPIEFRLEKFRTHMIDYPRAHAMFAELEFKSLDRKLDEIMPLLEPPKHEQQSLF